MLGFAIRTSAMLALLVSIFVWSARPAHAATIDICPADWVALDTAIRDAGPGGVVRFTCSKALDSGAQIELANVTIDGNGFSVILRAVAGDRLFRITSGVVALNGLTLLGGLATEGAAIYVQTAANLSISNSTIGNSSWPFNDSTFEGGAIYNRGTLLISDSVFTQNYAAYGGAISNRDGNLKIRHSTFSRNDASTGGAIYSTGGVLDIERSSITRNTAGNGGAIESSSTTTLVNSTVSNNESDIYGGGIRTIGGTFVSINSTIAYNKSIYGAGITVMGDSNVFFLNTILANSDGPNCTLLSPPESDYAVFLGGNLSTDATCPNVTEVTLADLKLGPLPDLITQELIHKPGAGSVAIRAGVPGVCAAPPVSGMDQRGKPRGTVVCDSGAYDTNSGPAFTPPIITPLLNPAQPSGANGWYTGDVTLNWIVTEPDVPETLAMTGCESQSVLTDQVKVDYSCQASSADGDTGPVVVTIGRDTTPPVVAVTGVTDGATYALGAVPTAGCSTTDATSGVALQARLLTDGGPLGEVTATCVTGVDYAGNIAWASATYTVKESGTSSPEIEYTLDPATPTGSNGWYVGDVSLHWTIPDVDLPDSVVLTGCQDQTITADQVKTTYTCAATFEGGAAGPVSVEIGRDATPPAVTITGVTNGATYPLLEVPSAGCETADATSGVATEATVSTQGGPFGVITVRCSGATDHAGNSGSAEMTYTVVDGTPPTVSYSLDPGSPTGSNGWYTEDVTLTWIVTETDTPDTLTQVGCANQAITADQSKTTYSCQATSDGGSSSVVNVVIGRDTVPPVVTVTGATDGATYTVSSVPTVACTTTDTTSGVLSEATMTHSGGPLGMITVTCADGQDDAGNLSSATISYFVTDDTPPVITSTINPETATGANGWYVDDVTLSWTVTETDSPESLVLSGCADQEITSDQLKMIYTCAATSDGGVAGPVSIEIGRDAAPPVVTVTGVADGATYPSDAVPVAGCATSDATSGVATEATLVITGGLIGQVTATCSGALDLAGNTNTTSVTYTVTDGTPPTISYHLSPETPDGSNEWYTSDVTLTWSVSDLESPTSIVLDGCEDQTIVADQAETTYSCGATSDGGVATLIVVEIGRDSTPPTVTITGVNSGATYTSDAVPSAGCTTSDATSGVAHEASLSTSGGPVGQVTITCSGAQDVAGNTGSATLTFTVVAADTTAPEVSFTLNPVAPDGSESWYVSDVTLAWIIIEPESPDTLSLEGCTDLMVTADQQKTSYSCIATSAGGSSQHVSAVIGRDATPPTVTVTGVEDGATYTYSAVPAAGCTTTDALSGVAADATLSLIGGPVGTVRATCAGAADHAGNSGSAEVTYNVVDDTPPTINYSLNPETPKGSNGWYTSDVLLHWTISESQSPDSVIITGCEDRTISLDQVKTTYSCSATSAGGTAAQVDVVVGRDTSLPTVVVTGVEDGATYVYGAVPTVGCSTTDATSGVAVDATPTSVGGPVGEITVICDGAVDHAGNPGSATATITVLYDWQGFASISNGPRGPRKVLAGQAMSIVFTIRGNVGLDAVTSITTIACNAGPTVQPVPAQPAGNRGELQTTANGQYLFQWQTSRAWAGSCQILQVNLTDGTTHEMRVEFQR